MQLYSSLDRRPFSYRDRNFQWRYLADFDAQTKREDRDFGARRLWPFGAYAWCLSWASKECRHGFQGAYSLLGGTALWAYAGHGFVG